jgi:hypothetical protein
VNLIGRICRLSLCASLCILTCSILAGQQQPGAPPPLEPTQTPAAQPQTPPAKPQNEAQVPPPAKAEVQSPAKPPVQAQTTDTIERMLSIGLFDWVPNGGPSLHAGTQAILPPPHELQLPQRPSRAYGVLASIPTKGSTRLEFSYLMVSDHGNAPAPTDLGLFGGTIAQGEPLAMDYSLRHLKVSWNYLTYPNPPDAKFRVKTLWEFHYIQVKPTVIATVTAPDQPLAQSERVLLPAVGLGVEYVASRHFRMELRGSGMMLPHRSAIGDSEGNAVVRLGSIEIFVGGKFLYFRTSPKNDTYVGGSLWGPQAGVRWVFR